MSQEKPSETKKPATHESKSSGMKWLAGAAAAALLLGGGYYAWSQYGSPQSATASNQQSFAQASDESMRAGPLPGQSADNAAAPNDLGASSPSESQTAAATSTRRHAVTRDNAVPEEVIGVTPASATSDDDANAIIVEGQRRPVWTQTPSNRRLAETYPARALERGREGEASVHCTVLSNGALDCVPVSEYPARAGFSGAALRVAHMYRHAQTRRDGTDAVGSPVNLRVVFRISDDERRG